MENNGSEAAKLVQIYLDKDGYLIQAGEPRKLTYKEYKGLPEDFQSRQITIEEYRATEWKWIYDKPITALNKDNG